jgi:integrase
MKNALSPQKSPGYTLVAECLYRNDASGIYYALIKRSGKQIRRSLKTPDRKLAERRLVEFREKVGGLSSTRGKVQLSFSEVANQWFSAWKTHLKPSSAERRLGAIEQLSQSLGPVPVRNVTRAQCEAWAERRSPDVAAATFNLERDTLQMVLDYAKREGLILDNPATVVQRRRQPKQTVVIPSRDQFAKMLVSLRSMSTRCHPAADLIELLAYSGMRKGEANAFRLADVDFDRNTFNVTGGETGTKNHEARVVPLFPVLHDYLIRLQKENPRPKDEPLVPIVDAKKALRTVCKLNGFPHFTHHCMRHFFVSNALEKGVDFKTIAAWVGHKDGGLLVAKTYGHLRDTHSFEMAKRITL